MVNKANLELKYKCKSDEKINACAFKWKYFKKNIELKQSANNPVLSRLAIFKYGTKPLFEPVIDPLAFAYNQYLFYI